MKFSLRRRRTIPDLLVNSLLGLAVFGLSWYNFFRYRTVDSLWFLIGMTALYLCLIAAELVAAVRRSVVLDGGKMIIRSGLRPACVLPLGEIASVTLTRKAPEKKVPLFRRYGKAHRSGADSLILTCKDGKRFRLAVEYHQKFCEEVMSRLK